MTFKCFIHKFETEDVSKWDEHNQKESHTVIGSAPCNLCGIVTEFEFKGKRKLSVIPCICKECKKGF
jgi:hypothetical protein